MSEKNKEKEPQILESSLEDILADRFARYSKYIIQERALPDARDGLKPVQRRILYAMEEAGNTFDHPYHKSAKTVGNVIGNYHPHGDSSVYDAMVRLSQPWKIRYPLIDMQGNNGSIDDDPAAAMRYTECRLSKISNYLLEDLDKNTVEWVMNFSDEKMEPTVLPARYPNLLVEGISGIAAGYACNIPPHNLEEILEATIYRIRNPKSTLQDLMQIVKGPDFPTGGIILSPEGIEQAFKTGKGKIYIRSKTEVKETKTLTQIIITEIPYEVVKSALVKKIDEIRLNSKIPGIMDVRDESGRAGLRIVIDLKKEIPVQPVLNYLYKNTSLQVSYSYNMVAIVNKSPVLVSLEAALDAFIEHREDIVLRRSQFDLDAKTKRLHILEGLIRAVSVMDEIIKIIRSSKDKQDSKKNLINRFAFTEAQAEAIVTMRLYRLSNTDILELEKEKKQLDQEVNRLKKIISSKRVLHNVLVKELEDMKKEFPTKRLTAIENKSAEVVIDEKAMIPDEEVMVALSRDGYIKRVSMRSFNASNEILSGHKDSDIIRAQGLATTKANLLFFTDRGTYSYLPVYSLKEMKWKDLGEHISSYVKMDSKEKIISAYLFDELDDNTQIVLASKEGFIKRMKLSSLKASRLSKTMTAMKIAALDSVVGTKISYSEDENVILATENGYGLQYPIVQIPESSLKSRGVKAINLSGDDHLKTFFLDNADRDQIVLWDKDAKAKRMRISDIANANRPAKGNRLYKALKKNPVHLEGLLNTKASEILPFTSAQEKASAIPLSGTSSSMNTLLNDERTTETIPHLYRIQKGTWSNDTAEEEEQLSLFRGEENE